MDSFTFRWTVKAGHSALTLRKRAAFLLRGLAGGDYRGLDLSGLDLSGRDLSRADLSGVDLRGAKLTGAYLDGAVLDEAQLAGVRSGFIRGVPEVLPCGWMLVRGHLVGAEANLRGANFAGADLARARLRGADIDGANFDRAILTRSNPVALQGHVQRLPSEWKQVGNCFVGPGVDLTGGDLRGADLSDVNLTGAHLTGTDLTGACIKGAQMREATLLDLVSHELSGEPATLPTRCRVVRGYLVGPGVQLIDADLSGADLSDLDLRGANIRGAVFEGVELSGAHFTDLRGEAAVLPLGWAQAGGYLFGPRANLAYADLRGWSLSGVQLPEANLAGARLTKATLRNVNLRGADLSGVDLGGALLEGVDLRGARMDRANIGLARFNGCSTEIASPSWNSLFRKQSSLNASRDGERGGPIKRGYKVDQWGVVIGRDDDRS